MIGNRISLLFFLFFTVNHFVFTEKNVSTFVPSREWQPVRKGQPIPSGLHVRHNFATGVTEAKLLDEETENNPADENDNSKAKSLTLHPDKSIRHPEEDDKANDDKKQANGLKISPEELKARLKKIKLFDKELMPEETAERSKTDFEEGFRSYDNLKNELKALEVNVTTEAEMLATFFERFQRYRHSVATETLSGEVTEDVLHILNELEYLLHQIDNAQIFADMGGMAKIISPCFNATNDKIKAEALRVLGTAVQSNPKVQNKALENDFVQKLLHLLVVNNGMPVQSRCMFAISALIRQHPIAQKALIDHGGLEIFGKILEDGYAQTQSRIMKLITDLAIERRDLKEIEDEELRRKKQGFYTTTNFEEKLLIHDYCRHLSNLMIKSFSKEAFGDSNTEDYDFLAVTLDNMIALGSICERDFNAEKYSLSTVMREALLHYESVRETSPSDHDDSSGHLVSLMNRLRTRLRILEEAHDEL